MTPAFWAGVALGAAITAAIGGLIAWALVLAAIKAIATMVTG